MSDFLFYDVESKSRLDLTKVGAYRYAADKSTEMLCLGYALDDEPCGIWLPGEPVPKRVASHIKKGGLVVAFNAPFERQIHSQILGPRHGWPIPELAQYRCAMAMSLALALPGSLEGAASAMGAEVTKDKVGKRVMMQMTKPRKPRKGEDPDKVYWHNDEPKLAQLIDYCIQDVRVTRELFDKIWPLIDEEQFIWQMDQRINDRGFHVDEDLLLAMRRIIIDAGNDLNTQIRKKTNNAVGTVDEIAKIKTWIEKRFNKKIKSLDKKTIPELLKDNKTPAAMKEVLELRLAGAQAATKKVDAFLARRSQDGRVRGAFVYHAAGTGRWASRGAQVHNLKRLITEEQEEIASAVDDLMTGDYKILKTKYARPLQVVGDNIRTCITAAPGNVLIGADFSGIEARVTAWLAGEEKKLQVFRDYDAGIGPDPYVAAAASVFGLSLQEMVALKTSNPNDYKIKRQGGKGAELAFGFQGGVNAYVKFVPEGLFTLPQIDTFKNKWRAAHPNIRNLWDGLKSAGDKIAKKAALRARGLDVEIESIPVNNLLFEYNNGFMFIVLPSGRRISYPQIGRMMRYREQFQILKPEDRDASMGQLATYFMDNSAGHFHRVFWYGGLGCVTADTHVLTTAGWKPIVEIQKSDKVWDGVEWVSHDGVVFQGVKEAKALDGVRMTYDHKVLTDHGWVGAAQAQGLHRTKVRLPDGYQGCRHDRSEAPVVAGVHLRQENQASIKRILDWQSSILRMQEEGIIPSSESNTRFVVSPALSRTSVDGRTLQAADTSGMEELWGSRHQGVQALAEVRELLGRHAQEMEAGFITGTHGQQRQLHAEELHLVDADMARTQPAQQQIYQNAMGQDDYCRSSTAFGPWSNDTALSNKKYAAKEMVFDLVNCGPRNRFVVRGNTEPFIIHNCENVVQGIARDLLAEAMRRVEAAGFAIVAHVHDEAVIEVAKKHAEKILKEFVRLMTMLPWWAQDNEYALPVVAKGWMAIRYVK